MIDRVVIPNTTLVTVLLVVFEAGVAVMILLRGDLVQPALLLGGGFAVVGAAVSSSAGSFVNLALASGLFALGLTR